MDNKIGLFTLLLGAGASMLTQQFVEKIIMTTIAMAVGTVVSFYIRRFLENRNRNKN